MAGTREGAQLTSCEEVQQLLSLPLGDTNGVQTLSGPVQNEMESTVSLCRTKNCF